jgi:hypothetical protein
VPPATSALRLLTLPLLRLPTIIGANSISQTRNWQPRDGEQVVTCNASLLARKHFLIGIAHIRNEALILRDTLDHVEPMSFVNIELHRAAVTNAKYSS